MGFCGLIVVMWCWRCRDGSVRSLSKDCGVVGRVLVRIDYSAGAAIMGLLIGGLF